MKLVSAHDASLLLKSCLSASKLLYTKDWHGDGDSSNTAVTAIIAAVMGTIKTVFPWEWKQKPR